MILTPHPGEFARLAQALQLNEDPIKSAARPAAAERLAQRLGCIVVLKGHGTVVSDGTRTWVCTHGNDALAIGGSGGVLSGVIGGLVAQYGAARTGGTAGMLATELAAEIPAAVAALRTLARP
ncbi:MAG: hydroxyethylthiazole kinase [Planctomycetota bacterium]|nr:hydroxyethylthiazole kinase [Planctomycetota bacterium]